MRRKNKLRKQYQRSFNHLVKALNKNIAEDNLWRGRFVFHQMDAELVPFEDQSGAMLYVQLRAIDKKTGYYRDFRVDYAPWLTFRGYKVWEIGNNFIVKDSGVWEEDPRPDINTALDYTKMPIPKESLMGRNNYYLSYKNWRNNAE